MARSRHRKTHKQALTHWKTIHCAPQPAPTPRPPRAVKPIPQRETRGRIATVTTQTPEGWEAELEGGGLIKITNTAGATLQKGDRFAIDYPLGGANRNGDVIRVESLPKPPGPIEDAFFKAGQGGGASQGAVVMHTLQAFKDKPLRGATRLIGAIDDMADWTPAQKEAVGRRAGMSELAKLDFSELEKRVLALPEVHGPAICSICGNIWPCREHSKPSFVSMGCTAEDPGRGLAEKVFGPGAQAHLEMALEKTEDGQLRCKEISICPGPDPEGLTTL